MPGPGGSAPGGVPGGDPRMATAAGGTHPTGMHSCFSESAQRFQFLHPFFLRKAVSVNDNTPALFSGKCHVLKIAGIKY